MKKLTKYVYDWFERSDEDLQTAEILLSKGGTPNTICFHAQQAAEKYLKGFLAYHEKYVRKIHDLGALLNNCGDVDSSFEKLRADVEYLTKFYTKSRYPDDYVEFKDEDARKALGAALRVKGVVLSKLKIPELNGFGLISIIIVVAIIGIFAGGGLYWQESQSQKSLLEIGKQKEKEAEALKNKILQRQKAQLESIGEGSSPSPSPTPKPSPQPTLTVDTSNWKTYRNEKYGFEVRYPKEWRTILYADGPGIQFIPEGLGVEEALLSLDLQCVFATGFEGELSPAKKTTQKAVYGSISFTDERTFSGDDGRLLLHMLSFDLPDSFGQCRRGTFVVEGVIPVAVLQNILSTFKFTK